MDLLDRFLPPPGAAGAVRVGADRWRQAADRLEGVGHDVRHRSAVLTTSWEGPARAAFDRQSGAFVEAVLAGAGLLRRYAVGLDDLAVGIERAQDEYHQRIGAVIGTAVVGGLLTGLTATLSDEVAAGVVTAEMAAVTELAITAAGQAVALLSSLAAQTAALAARWVVLTGVLVTADGVSGTVVHHGGDPLAYVHWADDAEFGLIGAVGLPLGAGLAAGAGQIGGGVLAGGATGALTRIAATGVAMAGADGVVRAALRQRIDPGELAMAALPLGRSGRRVVRGIAPEGTLPLGFADAEEFAAFGAELKKGLAEAGYGDAVPVFQGSAVTGVKYTTGQPFDVGRRSDFDIAVADARLFERLRSTGLKLRARPARTPPLDTAALRAVGLERLRDRLVDRAGRKVAFMVYHDVQSALDRAGGVIIR
jgi:uncharacterized protein YukE